MKRVLLFFEDTLLFEQQYQSQLSLPMNDFCSVMFVAILVYVELIFCFLSMLCRHLIIMLRKISLQIHLWHDYDLCSENLRHFLLLRYSGYAIFTIFIMDTCRNLKVLVIYQILKPEMLLVV